MLLLAFDTATPAVTVALHDGDSVVAEASTVDARRHGELLVPGIHDVLGRAGARPADLTGIAVGVGPGPYTGLRVGLATAQALGGTLGIPAYGLFTLDAVACDADLPGPFLAATDARRKEVFWARYDTPLARSTDVAVNLPADVPAGDLPVAGPGALMYADVFGDVHGPAHPSAAALARLAVRRLAEGGELLPPHPVYLRRPDARVPGKPKKVRTARMSDT
ncbi:MAG: tRNA (adenosine(37)-N6)-threonylcarbamoyltransferase complex dimerization subunit type 1 TsaB [Streptosporangiales bacterium]|nr:tRNA (adenosine(37)-N6)-threonylcarbamoyltransferase complex dimerization subunit type 1 TsaB [Streptosporangiales bacterium]